MNFFKEHCKIKVSKVRSSKNLGYIICSICVEWYLISLKQRSVSKAYTKKAEFLKQ
jgi:hypothetical protein